MSDNNFLKDLVVETVMSRRSFMKWSAAVGGTAVALANIESGSAVAQTGGEAAFASDKVVWQSCMVNCGSRCPLRLHIRDGAIVRVETDNTGDDTFGNHQVRACVRGRTIRQRVYDPDRLKYPMKRVGKRGSGEFERITWEEAFDTIANKLKDVVEQYGNEAVYINYATGTLGGFVAKSWPPASSPIARLMNCYGGYLNHYGTYSTAQIAAAMPYTYGSGANNSIEDIANTKLVVFFGNNPAETRMSGGGIIYATQQYVRQSGARFIVIDPRLSDTAVTSGDEWIAIRPGTDAALVSGLAYVMITENLHDKEFLDTYTVGFDKTTMPEGYEDAETYEEYILGQGADGTPKTPEWAARITGIPAARIIQLAREIALAKPAYIAQGWGPQRQANGEQNCRAIAMLSILTGNVGLQGGSTGAREGSFGLSGVKAFPTLENPVKTSISVFMWPDAIDRGPEMTALRDGVRGKDKLDVPIKFMWNYAGNCIINQHSDHNGTIKLLEDDTKCEMIVVIENHMTSSAKLADILLPDITNFEQNDMTTNGGTGPLGYAIFCEQAIEPMFECKSVYEMCREIAARLGVEEQFTEGRTQEEWLQHLVELTRADKPEFPDYETFKAQGIYKVTNTGAPSVAHKAFREDPVANPLNTPSGKIEIFSARLHDMSKTWELPEIDVISGLPIYAEGWEGPSDPLREKYPLQCIGHHYKQRTHSTYGNVPWMQEAAPQEVWMNPIDAEARGIKHGDMVYVFNDRGRIYLPAKVTRRIIPGALSVPQGAWFKPNAAGVDEGGSVNTLTKYHPSPLAKGNPQHTNLVEVEKA
jgi:anaerobic dimethyl sulfoxide reductase subunit A